MTDARNKTALCHVLVFAMPCVGADFRTRLVKQNNIGCDKARQQTLSRLITDICRLLIVGMCIAVAHLCVSKILIMIITRLHIRLNCNDIFTPLPFD